MTFSNRNLLLLMSISVYSDSLFDEIDFRDIKIYINLNIFLFHNLQFFLNILKNFMFKGKFYFYFLLMQILKSI